MSVLTEIVNQRASWGKRELGLERKVRKMRAMLEYVLLATIGLVVYCYHTELLEVARIVF